jgi:hypothetical protein
MVSPAQVSDTHRDFGGARECRPAHLAKHHEFFELLMNPAPRSGIAEAIAQDSFTCSGFRRAG